MPADRKTEFDLAHPPWGLICMSLDNGVLVLARKGLRQDHCCCRGGSGNAGMAMDEQVTEAVTNVAAKRQYCLDIRSPWENDPRRGLDRAVKMERGAQVLIKGPKRGWITPREVIGSVQLLQWACS